MRARSGSSIRGLNAANSGERAAVQGEVERAHRLYQRGGDPDSGDPQRRQPRAPMDEPGIEKDIQKETEHEEIAKGRVFPCAESTAWNIKTRMKNTASPSKIGMM